MVRTEGGSSRAISLLTLVCVVGESSRLEIAITVTGLKPGHFYNVRVIAVGSSNFQAGSQVIRLRTYGRDGRPQLNHGRVPSNFAPDDQMVSSLADSSDESPAVRSHGVAIESAPVHEGAQTMARESSTGQTSNRRNTVSRKHSPSIIAADQAASARKAAANEPEASMQQLAERFETIRKETEEIVGQVTKDAEDFKSQLSDLMKEKEEKRQALKEKEEASEKLSRESNYANSANRQAQNRKAQKEKTLRDKQAERAKANDGLLKLKMETDTMKEERAVLQKDKENLLAAKISNAIELRKQLRDRQNSLNGLEEEIRIKGLQIVELKEERRHLLPGAHDDEESRERDAIERQREFSWECVEKDLLSKLSHKSLELQTLQLQYQQGEVKLVAMQNQNPLNPIMYHGNSSGVDFEPAPQGKVKSRRSRNRKSRTNTISSPVYGFPINDPQFPSASAYNNLTMVPSPPFAPGPYFDPSLSHDAGMVPLSDHMKGMSEADIRLLTAGAPISPTAASLLPSNIFTDDEPSSPGQGSVRSFGPALYPTRSPYDHENDPQSPESSSRSASLFASPNTSSPNLPMFGIAGQGYGVEPDRRSLNSTMGNFGAVGSPGRVDQRQTQKGFGNFFNFPRPRGKTLQEDGPDGPNGPALGSLKPGQSQSFPRSTEDPDIVASRQRRGSLSSGWNVMPSFLRASASPAATDGNAPAPARNDSARRRRGFNMFSSSIDSPAGFFDSSPGSPRPVSIASSDLPRPSSESAPFGWSAGEGAQLNRNSPLATNWSINLIPTWGGSRAQSRRPSIQHGSSTALTSGIASDDDDFLPPSETLAGQTSPPSVGVIGTRPTSSHKVVTPKLNPAAPTFKVKFGRSSKADKGKSKDNAERPTSSDSIPISNSTFPLERRRSRDTPSVHTQHSMADSHDSLEQTSSNTPSDSAIFSSSAKSQESSFRQLLKKSSSSKFSFSSIRGKDSASLFGTKKGGSSVSNSERKPSIDESREDGEGDGAATPALSGSPMIGSGVDGKKEKTGVNWGRAFGMMKPKGRESLDVDRSEAGTEDEGGD